MLFREYVSYNVEVDLEGRSGNRWASEEKERRNLRTNGLLPSENAQDDSSAAPVLVSVSWWGDWLYWPNRGPLYDHGLRPIFWYARLSERLRRVRCIKWLLIHFSHISLDLRICMWIRPNLSLYIASAHLSLFYIQLRMTSSPCWKLVKLVVGKKLKRRRDRTEELDSLLDSGASFLVTPDEYGWY